MPTSIRKRWEIIFLFKHPKGPKMTKDKIAKYLKIDESTVRHWITREEETGDVQEFDKSGRPRCTTEHQDSLMVKMAEAEKPMTTQQIANQLAKKGVLVTRQTVASRLHEHDLYYGKKTKKPLLTDRHIEN